MSDKIAYKNLQREGEIDLDEIRSLAHNGQKISIIKELRAVSGLGLKASKDLVETYERKGINGWEYNVEELIDEFKRQMNIPTHEPFTKEEFMNTIERAIDMMDTFHYTDMIIAVRDLLDNIDKKGGLDALAKERDEFLRNI